MDEDGRLKGLPINKSASEIWRANFGEHARKIVGNVIILKDGARMIRR